MELTLRKFDKIKQLSPEMQAYIIAAIGLSSQYVLSFSAYFGLFPDIMGKSLNGATKNLTYLIPGILAICSTLWLEGGSGLRRIFSPYLRIPLNPLWWIFCATCLIPILYTALYLNDLLYGLSGSHTYTVTSSEDFKRFIAIFVQVAICDELLWIGVIYPRLLAANYHPLKAALAIGILWGLDYLPFLFTDFFIASGLNGSNILLGWLSLTPIYIWIYHKTRSATLVIFFNVCMQFTFSAIPVLPQDTGSNAQVAMTNLLCLAFGYILWRLWHKGKPYDLSFTTQNKMHGTDQQIDRNALDLT